MSDLLDQLGILRPADVLRRRNGSGYGDRTPAKPENKEVLSPVATWEPFPVDALPEPVRGFVQAGAKAVGTDPAQLATVILPPLASAIGNSAVIRLKSGWTEPAVLWMALIAESGDGKSVNLDLALKPIRRRQAVAIDVFNDAMKQYEADCQTYESDRKAWQAKGRAKGEPPPEKPEEPTCKRFYCSDTTVEALADRLQRTPRGILLARDELAGWLGSFDAYKNSRGDVAHWLSMYNARDLLVDRKSAGQKPLFAPRACVSIVGTIQPGTFRRFVGPEHYENGLTPRLLVAMPPRHARRWTEAVIDRQTQEAMNNLFGRLYALQPGTDENGKPIPTELDLTQDGKREWVRFYNDHAGLLLEAVGHRAAVLSKIEAVAARLSLIIHLVRLAADDSTLCDAEAIDAESVVAGICIGRWFAHEADRVYAILQENEEAADQRELVEWIRRKGGRVSARDLQRGPRQFRAPEIGEAALVEMVKQGFGRWEDDLPGPDGGRPTRVFRLATTGDGDTTSGNTEETGVLSPPRAIDVDEVSRLFDEAAEESRESEAVTW